MNAVGIVLGVADSKYEPMAEMTDIAFKFSRIHPAIQQHLGAL
jgi:hypothetical protein